MNTVADFELQVVFESWGEESISASIASNTGGPEGATLIRSLNSALAPTQKVVVVARGK